MNVSHLQQVSKLLLEIHAMHFCKKSRDSTPNSQKLEDMWSTSMKTYDLTLWFIKYTVFKICFSCQESIIYYVRYIFIHGLRPYLLKWLPMILIIFGPRSYSLFFLNLIFKYRRNYGNIMPGEWVNTTLGSSMRSGILNNYDMFDY